MDSSLYNLSTIDTTIGSEDGISAHLLILLEVLRIFLFTFNSVWVIRISLNNFKIVKQTRCNLPLSTNLSKVAAVFSVVSLGCNMVLNVDYIKDSMSSLDIVSIPGLLGFHLLLLIIYIFWGTSQKIIIVFLFLTAICIIVQACISVKIKTNISNIMYFMTLCFSTISVVLITINPRQKATRPTNPSGIAAYTNPIVDEELISPINSDLQFDPNEETTDPSETAPSLPPSA